MKKLFFALMTIAFVYAVSSCSSTKVATKTQAYLIEHCDSTSVTVDEAAGTFEVNYECGGLFDPKVILEYCPVMNVCFDATKGKLYGTLKCKDGTVLTKLAIQKLIAKASTLKK